MQTVICHFYNEEYLLPWWLNHHKNIFHHGIMIDYHSTDRSCEIIKSICPNWKIVTTRNSHFDSLKIDQEVMDYEKDLTGWRMALNVTEFLYGNIQRLDDSSDLKQIFLANYVFIDPHNTIPNKEIALDQQCHWGYYQADGGGGTLNIGSRCNRSIHNHPIQYIPGRHCVNTEPTYNDLTIFYYGYAFLNREFLDRKLQIKGKMSNEELQKAGDNHPNTVNESRFIYNINQYHRPRCIDLSTVVKQFTELTNQTGF